jgi:N-acetylmuramoyl-L-alanine amidase
MPNRVRVTLDLDGATTYRSERVEDPPRLLVDIRAARPDEAVPIGTLTYRDSAATRVRVGLQPGRVTRVVVSLDGVSRYRLSTADRPYRIVIECERTAVVAAPPADASVPPPSRPAAARPTSAPRAQASAQPPAPLPSKGLPRGWSGLPAVEPIDAGQLHPPQPSAEPARAAALSASAQPEKPGPPPSPAAPTPPAPARASSLPPAASVPLSGGRGPYSMARQLGLGVSKVVIDPGHGGHDPGALGPGVTEAEVVLDVALRLEKLLKEAGVDVVMTRRTDEFVPLEDRPAMARREQADLFLSIHANASRARSARGVETDFLNFSTDPEAEEVAARENAATNRTIGSLPDILRAITLNNKLDESRSFAGLIQKAMADQLRGANAGLKNLGVKQAPFVVLIGAEMPSVLVEISFITNPQEGRLLKSGAYRQKIADALFDAVRGYQRSLKNEPASSRH